MRYEDGIIDGVDVVRINKTLAVHFWRFNKDVYVLPVHARLGNMWVFPWLLPDNRDESFDGAVNRFEAMNCNSELGNYSKFFVSKLDLELHYHQGISGRGY